MLPSSSPVIFSFLFPANRGSFFRSQKSLWNLTAGRSKKDRQWWGACQLQRLPARNTRPHCCCSQRTALTAKAWSEQAADVTGGLARLLSSGRARRDQPSWAWDNSCRPRGYESYKRGGTLWNMQTSVETSFTVFKSLELLPLRQQESSCMPNAGLSRECEELSQHKLPAAKGFFSALPRFFLFPGNRGAQLTLEKQGPLSDSLPISLFFSFSLYLCVYICVYIYLSLSLSLSLSVVLSEFCLTFIWFMLCFFPLISLSPPFSNSYPDCFLGPCSEPSD